MEPKDWQLQLSTVKERSQYAFNKSLFCDVKFSVVDCDGDKVTIPANKYILAISSPVFEAMFYGQLAETRPTIDLPDCTKEGLHELLRYVHSDKVNLTGDNVMEILYLADKYMMPFLSQKCRRYFKKEVQPENVFAILPEVSKMGDQELEQHCWDIVDGQTQPAVSSQAFLDISHELLCQVYVRDELKVKELVLFQAVDRWVTKRIQEKGLDCNGETKRAVLGEEVIRLIRFPLMPQKEFAEVVLPSGVLEMKEVTELIQISNSLSAETSFFSKKSRSDKDRLLIPNNRFDSIRTDSFLGYHFSGIDFQVNKTVNLVGVRLFGSKDQSHHVQITVRQLLDDNTGSYQSKYRYRTTCQTEEFKIDGLYYGFTIFFKKPTKLVQGIQYQVGFKMKGPHSYVGCKGKYVVSFEDLKVTYKNPRLHSNPLFRGSDAIEGGQIQTLIFKAIQ